MNASACEQLDDYLAGWLSEEESVRFETHLAGCSACRREAGLQRRIDRLLVQGAECLGPISTGLVDRIEGRIRHLRRQRRVRLAWSVSVAATVVLALGIGWMARYFVADDVDGPLRSIQESQITWAGDTEHVNRLPRPAPAQNAQVHVRLQDPSTAILRPMKTESHHVSIIWIYPTAKPALASHAPAADPLPSPQPRRKP